MASTVSSQVFCNAVKFLVMLAMESACTVHLVEQSTEIPGKLPSVAAIVSLKILSL